ncbi:cache domain-containing sensor histidine kinase [Butyrivibrio sp. MC2013]|uniref:cache domain-containing sensor histidine kinase n=1 Tax=Butyrivibrio sp. MC2013 TaxID=1280686 RepID=UPI00041AD90D|nr:sensor histidine kinase [Butyrivibrio sp. MC2013]
MKKIKELYSHLSITVRFTLIIVLAFILLASSILFSAGLYTKEKLASYRDIVESNNNQLLDKADSYISDIANVTKIPLTYKENDMTYMSLLSDFNKSGNASYEFQRQNEQIFEQIMMYKSDVNSCFIFNNEGNGDYKVKYAIYTPFDPTGEEWFLKAVEGFGKPVFVKTYELPEVVNEKLRPLYVFGIARGIVMLRSGSVIGILLVNTDVSFFRKLCDDVKLSDGHRFLIMKDDYCIYDSAELLTASDIPEQSVISTIADKSGAELYKCSIDGITSYAGSVSSDTFGLRIISIIPSDELLGGISRIRISGFIQLLLIIFAVLMLTYIAIRKVVKPITLLSSMMKVAESGDYTAHVKIDGSDEIARLADSYNSLIDKTDSLINEVYLEKIAANEMELQMLQAQINPHFLYNTLESISMMAIINDDDTTADMAATLGSILRYSISDLNKPVSLGDEVSHIKSYIQLLEYRFKKQYSFELDIPAMLYSVPTPRLILQPVVENAIYHGMNSVREGGLVKVSAVRTGENALDITVTDNGIGMDRDMLDNLNDYINEKNDLFKSIGLRNVNRRIKLFCGKDAGLFVYNAEGGGTKVVIRLT